MKFSAILVLFSALVLCTFPVQAAEEDGRYRIIAPSKTKIILLDSAMGRTWLMTKENEWKQIEFFRDGRGPRNQITPEKMSPTKSKRSWDGGFSSKPLDPAKPSPLSPLKPNKTP
ncbi:MAG: hypothetical protein HN683_09530 [Gammaproteobacteria bacterium]|jgi:hypothetical protein|nr:hypothetical protein [Gammaproteobacteria bacterium]